MESILIIKLGAMGDVLMAIDVAKALKKKSPCHITWLAGDAVSPLLKEEPAIDRVVSVSHNKILTGSWIEKMKEVAWVWRQLMCKNYDLIINLHKDYRYKFLTVFTRCNEYRGFDRRTLFPLGEKFHGDWYLDIAKVSLSSAKNHKTIEDTPIKKIILCPGGALEKEKNLRVWPLENYVALAKKLQEGFDIHVVGANYDQHFFKAFEKTKAKLHIGTLNLLELKNFFCDSSLVVSHDGGLFHLARYAGAKRLGLFGPTSRKNFSKPVQKFEGSFTGSTLNCSPCYSGRNFAVCSHKQCMINICVKDILSELNSMF